MALDSNSKKTEHNGAKNQGHDKPSHREEMKLASKKRRRQNDKATAKSISQEPQQDQ